ncbi:MAG TPA: S8 family serine peptidase [bacterium]|nr:S8 family serine peptidase [bacterium]
MRQIVLLCALACGLTLHPGTVQSAIHEHDPHTLIVKFAPFINGTSLARGLNNAKSAVPAWLGPLVQAGIDSIAPLFPIPPKGLTNRALYDSLDMAQYFVATIRYPNTPLNVKDSLSGRDEIAEVELNVSLSRQEADATPNDPIYPLQWHYAAIDLPAAWDLTTGSGNITVAVLDDGIQYDHPDLQGVFKTNEVEYGGNLGVDDDANGLVDDVLGWDFGDDDNNPAPGTTEDTHGTHVAGTIGAFTNNGIGVAGVDWGCLVLPIRVFNSLSGSASSDDVTIAIYYAVQMGAKVINMSLGGYAYHQAQDVAVHFAYNSGVLCVAAAGNDDSSRVIYPAASDWALAVGATEETDARWWNSSQGSNYGFQLDVVAPGHQVWSTVPTWYLNPPYGVKSGTSMATPHVSGLASLLLSIRPTLSPDSLYFFIAAGAEDRVGLSFEDVEGWDPYHGWGRINAANSIRLALGQCVCKCGNDPNCDHVISSVADVVETVNVAFRGGTPVYDFGCPRQRTDFDGNGATSVADVVRVVNVAFRGGTTAANFVAPCP